MGKKLLAGAYAWLTAAGLAGAQQGNPAPIVPQLPPSPYGPAMMPHPSYNYGSAHNLAPATPPSARRMTPPPVRYQPMARPTMPPQTVPPTRYEPVVPQSSPQQYQPVMPPQPEMPPLPVPVEPAGLTQEKPQPASPPPTMPMAEGAGSLPPSDGEQVVPIQPYPYTPPAPGTDPKQPTPVTAVPTTLGTGGACPPGGCAQGDCATGCDMCCDKCPCARDGRVWLSGEWLYWVTNGYSIPALVTQSPAGTPRAQSGVLGAPGTVTLLGGETLHSGEFRSGFRVRGGIWLDDCETIGIDASYFFLGDDGFNYSAGGTGAAGEPQISRPFFNAFTNLADAELVTFPGVLAGTVTVDSDSEFDGADINVRKLLCCSNDPCSSCNYRLDWLIGYRYLSLDESLVITENLTTLAPAANSLGVPVGTNIIVSDVSRTSNEFNGGQLGLGGRYACGCGWIDFTGKIGFGVTTAEIICDGSTVINAPGQPQVVRPGGLLVQGTNIGRFTDDEFAVVPEGQVRFGYRVNECISAFVGYTFIYWSSVARPGDNIDGGVNPVINPTQIPPGTLVGPARPIFMNNRSDFWAQGVSLGLEARW